MTECNMCWKDRFDLLKIEIDKKLTYWRMIRDHEAESGSAVAISQAIYNEMCELWLAAHNMTQRTLSDYEEDSE